MAKTPEAAKQVSRCVGAGLSGSVRKRGQGNSGFDGCRTWWLQLCSRGIGSTTAEQVRKAKYDLDQSEIKPYFEMNNVLQNGVFYAAHELYGLTFKERQGHSGLAAGRARI